MWPFLAYLVVSLIISYALRPKPVTPQAEAFDDIDFPRAEEGTPQCVIFGDCWVPDWTVIAVGNYRTIPIVKRGETLGYFYAFGTHMGIAKAIDELVEIQVGDKPLWRGSVTENESFQINAIDLFGGWEREGGISGRFYMFFGAPDQVMPSDAEITATLTTPMPGYRNRVTAFFDGVMCARSPYPKPWKFRVRRITSGWDGAVWYPERAAIELTRPVSANEIQNTTGENDEVATVRSSRPIEVARDGGSGDLRVTLTGYTVVAVEEVWLWNGTTPLTLGLHYVVESGNTVIHFADVGENLGGGVNTVNFDGLTAIVRFQHTQTTVFPPSPDGLGTTRIVAMNPAHMLYECYTNREWGRGYPASSLNLSNTEGGLTYLADRLYNEGFGLCFRWNRKGGIKSMIQTILNTIGANVYTDRTTGKISFILMRSDYDRNTIPLFERGSGLISVTDSGISTQSQMVTEVAVTFKDPVTNREQPVRIVNTAAKQTTGGISNSQSVEMPAIPTAELATRVARREMRARSNSLRKYDVLLDRRGRRLVPGSLLRIREPARNIPDTVLRVGSIEYGPLGKGEIKAVCLRDVFGTPTTGFPTPPPLGGQLQNTRPCFDDAEIFELPYRFLKRMLSSGDFAVLGSNAMFGFVESQGALTNAEYTLAVKNGSIDSGTETPPDFSWYCEVPEIVKPAQRILAIGFDAGFEQTNLFYSDDIGASWTDTGVKKSVMNRFESDTPAYIGRSVSSSTAPLEYSADGISWAPSSGISTGTASIVMKAPTGIYTVVVDPGGIAAGMHVNKSVNNGVSWSAVATLTASAAGTVQSFRWLNDRFVLIVALSAGGSECWTSTNGTSWTSIVLPSITGGAGSSQPWYAGFIGGLFVLSRPDSNILTTPDFSTFTQRTVADAIFLTNSDAGSPTALVASGSTGLWRTTDGISYTKVINGVTFINVTYRAGVWIASGDTVRKSLDDGITWTLVSMPPGAVTNVSHQR